MKISPLPLLGVLFLCSPAMTDWHFRGTANQWSSTPLQKVSADEYQTCQSFQNGDAGGAPRFKIDRFGDWSESYPGSDYQVTPIRVT